MKLLRRRYSIATIMAWSGLVSALGFAIPGLLQVAGGTVILLGIATAGGTWTAFARPADKT